MGTGFFVTGTDTGVGKTVLGRALVRSIARKGIAVRAIKPVESGVQVAEGAPFAEDARALDRAAGLRSGPGGFVGYRLRAPLSPHLAAAMEGVRIERGPILELLSRSLDEAEIVIAEGAGGLLVPLGEDLLYADLIAESGYSLIVVAPNVLGTINATLTTLEAARSRAMEVTGVVLNRTPPLELGNAEAIARHGAVRILGELPTAKTDDDDLLADLAEARLDLSFLTGLG